MDNDLRKVLSIIGICVGIVWILTGLVGGLYSIPLCLIGIGFFTGFISLVVIALGIVLLVFSIRWLKK